VRKGGGAKASQWVINWDQKNSAGSCTLIDMEALDGTHHKILLDTGWNTAYMEKRFQEIGVDRMLQNGEIEFLFLSHEHMTISGGRR
jgi:7,8-dihydropterin-6-yl-methyl-4-(beta-D-ribofuranosyl)aminobenzene 5'-phosphate synthase